MKGKSKTAKNHTDNQEMRGSQPAGLTAFEPPLYVPSFCIQKDMASQLRRQQCLITLLFATDTHAIS